MGIIDIIKNRQQLKRETAEAEQIKNNMITAWSNLLEEYNQADQTSSNAQFMYRKRDGQVFNIGIVKEDQSTNNNRNYEFLFVYQEQDGQLTSQYYNMSSVGDFHKSDRGLGQLTINYLSNINGKSIPCTATIKTSTQELINIDNLPIAPSITPSISSYTPNECAPDTNEIYEILREFTIRENLHSARHTETSSDFTPGR